jgi:WD40 repeat protein
VGTLAFHPRGLTLASGSYDQTIKLWDVHAGQCLNTLQSQAGTVRSLAFNADGTILATCGLDETIKLWDMQAGTCLNILRGERPYERLNISAVTGLTGVQKAALKVLGAFEVDN